MFRLSTEKPILQRATMIVLVAAFVTLIVAAGLAFPVEAASCSSWQTIDCCDTWWPGLQNFQTRNCSECTDSGCYYWTEARCSVISTCSLN